MTDTAPESSLTLLSLASRQIWPHILAVVYLKPARLILLHPERPASPDWLAALERRYTRR